MKHKSRPVSFESKLLPNIQYTFVTTIGNSVYARGRSTDGAPTYAEEKYTPTYFLPVDPFDPQMAADTEGFDGTELQSVMLDNIREGKEFLDEHPEAFGNIQHEYMMLSDVYGDKDVVFDMDRLYIANIDIEVDRDPVRGYAPVSDPFNPITAITLMWRHMGESGVIVYGTGDYTPEDADVTYRKCADESEMLRSFLSDWRSGGDYPDIVTGWNIQFFDIPYLVNRMKLLFDEDVWTRLSPFQRLQAKESTFYQRTEQTYDIRGISVLDYYEVYRKFVLAPRENYRLDYIAHVELGERKLSYDEVRSLFHLYRQDHQKFIAYNVQDVRLVDKLDGKLKLLDLVAALAYSAKCNFTDTFKQVRLWDIMIYHKLRSLGKQIPPRKDVSKTEQYAGAYVKDPLVGMHEWVVSFDVASMYPHIIRQWNLSPETIIKAGTSGDQEYFQSFTDHIPVPARVDTLLDRSLDTSFLKKHDICMSGNIVFTKRDKEGFLPNMLKTLYDERVRFKKMMNAAEKELQACTDPERKKQLTKDVSAFNNQQSVRKVNLNSAYGALGSNYFRFYDTDVAEAVTITGQLIIRWVAKDVNAYLNRVLNTTDEDYVVASDTDSVYLRLGKFAELAQQASSNPAGMTTAHMVRIVDEFCEKRLKPVINKAFEDIADYLNVYIPCMSMAREVIADKGVWTAKKRYILNVYNKEGVTYDKPKLKIMGIEAVKSSTPSICRDMIKETLVLMMQKTQEDVWQHIETCRDRFMKGTFEDVAWPRGVNGLKKYAGREKGIPIHVRGALTFNDALTRLKLTKEYEPIHDGEKIKFVYLKEPNRFHSNVMSAPGGCPPEWKIEESIDYNQQFEKSFVQPMETILNCAGWSTEKHAALF